MENLRPFLATRTAVRTGSTVAAAAMLAVSAVAMSVAGGMLAVVGIIQSGGENTVAVTTAIPERSRNDSTAAYDGYIVEFMGDPIIIGEKKMKQQLQRGLIGRPAFDVQLRELRRTIDEEHRQMKEKILRIVPPTKPSSQISSAEPQPQNQNRLQRTDQDPEGPAATVRRDFIYLFNGLTLNLTDAEAGTVAKVPGVKAVHKNFYFKPLLDQAAPVVGADRVAQLDDQGGLCARSGKPCLTGQGVKVGVIDTGVDPFHEALGATALPADYALQRITGEKIRYVIPLSRENQTLDLHGNQLAVISHGPYNFYDPDGRHTIALYTLREDNQPPAVEFILLPAGLVPFKIDHNDQLLAYYAKDWKQKQTRGFNVFVPSVLYAYNFATGQHIKIAEYFPYRNTAWVAVEGKRIIYTKEYKEDQDTKVDIFVYDTETGEEQAVGDPISPWQYQPYLAAVSGNLVAYQQISSVIGEYCAPGGTKLYNLDDPAASFILPDITGPVMDLRGDLLLASTCEERRGENQYYLYNLKTNERTPVAENTRVPFNSYGRWTHQAKIGDGVVFFNRSASYIHATDLAQQRTVWVNPAIESGDFTADDRRVCFLDNEGEQGTSAIYKQDYFNVYCHTFDSNKSYQLINVYNQKVVGGYNFHVPELPPLDSYGHGTHVAGIIAGNASLRGVAPGTQLYAYKVGHASAPEGNIIAALERAVSVDQVDIINISLGGNGSPGDPIAAAVDRAVDAGVTVVVAAGNSGPGSDDDECRHKTLGQDEDGNGDRYSICSPGVAAKAITVGATYKQDYAGNYWKQLYPRRDQVTGFSSRGPVRASGQDMAKPDVVAPGAIICSSRYRFAPFCNGSSEYAFAAGTSMASPVVAGAAALIKQRHLDWTPEQIKQRFMETAVEVGEEREAQGAGRIDVLAALGGMVFLRGDANADGRVDISDAVYTLNVLFVDSSQKILCDDAADSNDDGKVDISDAINTLNYLFAGTGAIAAPGVATPGPDPTNDSLGCAAYNAP